MEESGLARPSPSGPMGPEEAGGGGGEDTEEVLAEAEAEFVPPISSYSTRGCGWQEEAAPLGGACCPAICCAAVAAAWVWFGVGSTSTRTLRVWLGMLKEGGGRRGIHVFHVLHRLRPLQVFDSFSLSNWKWAGLPFARQAHQARKASLSSVIDDEGKMDCFVLNRSVFL